jgi:hypothetical protein
MVTFSASAAAAQGVIYWQDRHLPGRDGTVSLDSLGTAVKVPGSPGIVFAQLRTLYRQLGVRTEVDDSSVGRIGSLEITRTQSFAGGWMSRIVDCGRDVDGRPIADNARVRLSMVTFVGPASGDSVMVRTGLVGFARANDGSSRETVQCSSRGYVETWLRVHLGGT